MLPHALRLRSRHAALISCDAALPAEPDPPPDDAMLPLWRALAVWSLHQPLPISPQPPPPPTVSCTQNCSSTCPRTLPLNNSELEMTRVAGARLMPKSDVLRC